MITKDLFERALNIQEPWYLKSIEFNEAEKRLDLYIDFKEGSVFHYESSEKNIKRGKGKEWERGSDQAKC